VSDADEVALAVEHIDTTELRRACESLPGPRRSQALAFVRTIAASLEAIGKIARGEWGDQLREDGL
jgi:hypothetical protein